MAVLSPRPDSGFSRDLSTQALPPKAEKIHVKPYFFLLAALFVPANSPAGPVTRASRAIVMSVGPSTSAGKVENVLRPDALEKRKRGGRGLASVGGAGPNEANQRLCEKIEPGQRYLIKNSVRDWEDQLVTVADKFEDCSVRVRMANGRKAFVRFENLDRTLSAEVDCLPSHGVEVCKNDTVFYPSRNSSVELPEGAITALFENNVIVVHDGADFVLDADQVGKSVECSPQKDSVCVGDYVYAEGFKLDRRFNFEGPIKKAYTHGVVIVETDRYWKYPIDVAAVKKRVASDDGSDQPAVVTARGTRGRELPYNVTPEIEPDFPTLGDEIRNDRAPASVPRYANP